MKNVVEAILSGTRKCAGKPALIDKKCTVTYAELLERVSQASFELKKRAIKKGDRVALLCDDNIDYVVLSLAVLALYAVVVPVPFASSREEVEAVLKEMKINFLIFENGTFEYPGASRLSVTSGLVKKFLLLARPSAGNPGKEFFRLNPAFIRFSSGTTGIRKGVIISHEAILERTDAADKGLRITADDTVLWVLSMSFHFVVTILLFLRRGATIILAGSPFPGSLLSALKHHRPTFIYASPLHYHLLARIGSVGKKELSKVRMAVSTAVELPFETGELFRAKFGFELSQAYGIIEVGLPFINFSRDVSKRGSVGRILPGYQIKIINQDSEAAGEICLKGPGLFSAYFSPWSHARTIMKGGWFNTGDIGRLDHDGFLFILGRAKNVINFNGMKIFPSEVEAVLTRHPLIREALVYGSAHPEYGNLPVADIVLRQRRQDSFDEQALRVFCYQHLAPYKVPKEFYCVARLEKTPSGKIAVKKQFQYNADEHR